MGAVSLSFEGYIYPATVSAIPFDTVLKGERSLVEVSLHIIEMQ